MYIYVCRHNLIFIILYEYFYRIGYLLILFLIFQLKVLCVFDLNS